MTEIHPIEQPFAARQPRSNLIRFILVAIAASAFDLTAFFLLDRVNLNPPTRLAAALLPLPGNLALLLLIVRRVRRLDEFQQRVQFEAVVIGFLATGVAVFIYAYLEKAHYAGPLNMGLVWLFMVLFYAVGYFVAVKHYK